MTPELSGRFQTRLFLFSTVGALATLPFAIGFGANLYAGLYYVGALGFAWDCVYHQITLFRWDRDWPSSIAFLAGIWEGASFYGLTTFADLPPFHGAVRAGAYWPMYVVTFLAMYLTVQGPIRVLVPHWRWNGGRVFEKW